jgi:hypothetical protein
VYARASSPNARDYALRDIAYVHRPSYWTIKRDMVRMLTRLEDDELAKFEPVHRSPYPVLHRLVQRIDKKQNRLDQINMNDYVKFGIYGISIASMHLTLAIWTGCSSRGAKFSLYFNPKLLLFTGKKRKNMLVFWE